MERVWKNTVAAQLYVLSRQMFEGANEHRDHGNLSQDSCLQDDIWTWDPLNKRQEW
jgi:hypothetical protein